MANNNPTYNCWRDMRKRCADVDAPEYPHYGGRGITVYERWQKFANFLADMGKKPAGMTFDRIDNGLGYSRDNCRWASRKTQQLNTRRTRMLTLDGETLCIRDWERKLGLGYGTIWRRLDRGWSASEALTK